MQGDRSMIKKISTSSWEMYNELCFQWQNLQSVNVWQAERIDFYRNVCNIYFLSLFNLSFALYPLRWFYFTTEKISLEMQNSSKIKKSNLTLVCMKWVPRNLRTIFSATSFCKTIQNTMYFSIFIILMKMAQMQVKL